MKSTGVMGYYQAQLNDMIQYPDLRTEVFQSLREIGNSVLFFMLIEQALVSSHHIHLIFMMVPLSCYNKKIKESLIQLFEQTKNAVSTTENNAKRLFSLTKFCKLLKLVSANSFTNAVVF
jgi:hypothetical protein